MNAYFCDCHRNKELVKNLFPFFQILFRILQIKTNVLRGSDNEKETGGIENESKTV